MTQVPDSQRHPVLLLLTAVLLAGLPVLFGFVRAISTGDDFRYLWLAASAMVGSLAVMVPGYRASSPARVSLGRAVGAVAAGAGCAAATAIFLGATAGPGVANRRGRVRALHWDQHGPRHHRTPTANAVNLQRAA